MSENDLDKTNAGKRLLGEGDSNNKTLPKAIAKETVDDFSYDQGSSSSDESEWGDNVVNGEGMNGQNENV
ncbi:hypothetical protein Alg215_11369 [Pyrenophora tritici-repentis]|nr:hypothetical protein Alg215_11369 [Pyrenophora tritici-repentis]